MITVQVSDLQNKHIIEKARVAIKVNVITSYEEVTLNIIGTRNRNHRDPQSS